MTFTTKAIFFPLIKLTKRVLQDVLTSVSRWLPPPWQGGGLPGSTWDALACAADAWVYSRGFSCRGGLARAVLWVLHGAVFPGGRYPPGVILACLLRGWWAAGLSSAWGKDQLPSGTPGTASPRPCCTAHGLKSVT